MFCLHCGKEIPDESIFCLKCGKSLEAVTRSTKAADQPGLENEAAVPTSGSSEAATPDVTPERVEVEGAYLEKRYAAMSDEDLAARLENRGALPEAAQKHLDQELIRRGIGTSERSTEAPTTVQEIGAPKAKGGRASPRRVLVGLLIALFSCIGLASPRTRNGGVIVLVLGMTLLCSGLPIRQRRWWAVFLGLALLYLAFDAAMSAELFGGVLLGLIGSLLIIYGLRPIRVENSK